MRSRQSSAKVAEEYTEARKIRYYTPQEDNLIFDTFWNVAEREELAKKLGRPLRGVTYRFYHILKTKGMSPEEYVAAKGVSKITSDGTPIVPLRRRGRPRKHWRWDDVLDIRLWRMHKGGRDLHEISMELGCPSEEMCQQRLAYLEARNAAEAAAVEIATRQSAEPVTFDLSEGTESQEDGSTNGLMVGSEAVDKLTSIESRLERLEKFMETLPSAVPAVHISPDTILNSLISMASQAKEVETLRTSLEMARNEQTLTAADLEREREALRQERAEMKEVYGDLEGVLHTFMNLSSIDKLRVLGDFSTRLEATVDKFGNVVNTKMTLG